MATILYHGTRNPDRIEKIDLTRAKEGFSNSEYGIGFYTSLNRGDGEANAGHHKGGAGWVYQFKIAGDYDGYTKGHTARWMSGFDDVDRALLEKICGAMKDLGGDFAERGEELMQRFDAGKLGWTGRNLIKNLQAEFGAPKAGNEGPTAADIFMRAGIDGARVNGGGYFLFLNPATLPEPVPYSFASPENPAANALGQLLEQISFLGDTDTYANGKSRFDAQPGRDIRFAVADAISAALKGDGSAYDKTLAVGKLLQQPGLDVPERITQSLAHAEEETAALAGVTPEDAARRRAAEEIVKKRPAREQDEGFIDYRDRLYAWHDAVFPSADAKEQQAFTTALFGDLYRDAQKAYAARTGDALAINNDPAKVERMLAQETPSKEMLAIQHIEYDLGTLRSERPVQQAARKPAAAFKL